MAFLKPQVVLWVYYEGNDSRDLDGREKNSSLLKQYLDPAFAQYLIHRQKEIDDVLADYLEQEMKSHAHSIHFEEVLKLRHVRTALHNLMDKRPVRDGISAELIEYLEQMNAPSRMGDLDLFGTILAQSRATVASWAAYVFCLSSVVGALPDPNTGQQGPRTCFESYYPAWVATHRYPSSFAAHRIRSLCSHPAGTLITT